MNDSELPQLSSLLQNYIKTRAVSVFVLRYCSWHLLALLSAFLLDLIEFARISQEIRRNASDEDSQKLLGTMTLSLLGVPPMRTGT